VTDDELGDTGDFDDFEEFESEFDGSALDDLDHLDDDDFDEFESEFTDDADGSDEVDDGAEADNGADVDDEPEDDLDATDDRVDDRADDETDELPPAIRARNWKTILAVDAACGFGVFVVGLVLMGVWNLYAGAFVASAALVYILLVGRRALQWRWLRRQAGL
jgi:hypothetical protein